VAELVAEADREQQASPRFRAELAAWTRSNSGGGRDGVPGYAYGLSDTASILHRLLARLRSAISADERRDRQYVRHSGALLALCTRGDAPADWLASGRALQRVLLRAAAAGLSASYFSPAIEVATVRARLRETLGEQGWPQALFRLGFGSEVRPTPRRAVEDVLRAPTTAAGPTAIVHPVLKA
jgi:hypothetical protein